MRRAQKNATKWKIYSGLQAHYCFLNLANHFSLIPPVFVTFFFLFFLLSPVNLLLMINLFWMANSER